MHHLIRNTVLILSIAALGTACSSTKPVESDRTRVYEQGKDPNEVTAGSNNSMQLVDYLRRVPGLQITQEGTSVTIMIRGMNSISGDSSPLYVINNQAVGNSYYDATSAVDVNDIKTVNVIKGPEGQQLYGMRGANGVIQIFTKKR